MFEQLSFIEKMEYTYVLMETKNLLNQKLEIMDNPNQLDIIKEDLEKINQELQVITNENPEFLNSAPLNLVFPHYGVEEE